MDSSLSFLDGFVSEALAAGAAPYKPHHQRQEELAQAKGEILRLRQIRTHMHVDMLCLVLISPDFDLFLSVKHGAIRPPHQHVVVQHRRQTVAYSVVCKLWSVG